MKFIFYLTFAIYIIFAQDLTQLDAHLDANLTLALDRSIAQLDQVLFPDNKEMSDQLRSKMDVFKFRLKAHMRSDMEQLLIQFQSSRSSPDGFTDEESYKLKDMLRIQVYELNEFI